MTDLTGALHRVDLRLESIALALREARANNELANIAICEQREDELLDERLLILAALPTQREGE